MTNQAPHFQNLNLFQLRLALIAAQKNAPARPPHAPRDVDELLALELIERIKQPQPVSFLGLQAEPPQPVSSYSLRERDAVHA